MLYQVHEHHAGSGKASQAQGARPRARGSAWRRDGYCQNRWLLCRKNQLAPSDDESPAKVTGRRPASLRGGWRDQGPCIALNFTSAIARTLSLGSVQLLFQFREFLLGFEPLDLGLGRSQLGAVDCGRRAGAGVDYGRNILGTAGPLIAKR